MVAYNGEGDDDNDDGMVWVLTDDDRDDVLLYVLIDVFNPREPVCTSHPASLSASFSALVVLLACLPHLLSSVELFQGVLIDVLLNGDFGSRELACLLDPPGCVCKTVFARCRI